MSFTENGRFGKTFHKVSGNAGRSFAETIADAIIADFGASPSALRRVAKLAHASERTVRNWLDGKNGPSGQHLIGLMRQSDAVFAATLALADREPVVGAGELSDVRRLAAAVLARIDGLQPPP